MASNNNKEMRHKYTNLILWQIYLVQIQARDDLSPFMIKSVSLIDWNDSGIADCGGQFHESLAYHLELVKTKATKIAY